MISEVADLLEMPLSNLLHSNRAVKNNWRDLLVLMLVRNTEYKQSDIAGQFNFKNYASASKAYKRAKKLIDYNDSLTQQYKVVAN